MRRTFPAPVILFGLLAAVGAVTVHADGDTIQGVDDDPSVNMPRRIGSSDATEAPVLLTPLDQAVGDRGGLDTSLRRIDPGLDMPTGYRNVYLRPGGGMMRANGGLAALFPRSIYVPTRQGLVPDVPPGTRFVIGGLPMGREAGHGRLLPLDPLQPHAIPDRVDRPGSESPDPTPGVGYGPGYRVATSAEPEFDEGLTRFHADEDYRRRRLQRLERMLEASFHADSRGRD